MTTTCVVEMAATAATTTIKSSCSSGEEKDISNTTTTDRRRRGMKTKKSTTILTTSTLALTMLGILLAIAPSFITHHQKTEESTITDKKEDDPLLIQNNEDSRRSYFFPPAPPINQSAEVSVLAGGELIAQSPVLDFVMTSIMRPAFVEMAVAVGIHSLGIPLLVSASKWLAPYSHGGWTTRHRFVGIIRYVKKIQPTTMIKKGIKTFWWSTRKISLGGGLASSQQTTTTPLRNGIKSTIRLLWDSTKKTIQNIYKKRSRYSVASELTNLIPAEHQPKEEEE